MGDRLRFDLNTGVLWSLPDWSEGPRGGDDEIVAAVKAAGYGGIQFQRPGPLIEAARAAGLQVTGQGFIVTPDHAELVARQHKSLGYLLSTVHVGDGLETDEEARALIEATLEASEKHGLPMLVETHRATVTQDIRRTVNLVEAFPQLRFNADLSHFYTGSEMTYGNFERKLDILQPVFDRVRYFHGRIGDTGCVQRTVRLDETDRHLRDFRAMWTRCFDGFLRTADPDEVIAFAPELLPYSVTLDGQTIDLRYGRLREGPDGRLTDESDRWTQSLLLCDIARSCYEDALVRTAA